MTDVSALEAIRTNPAVRAFTDAPVTDEQIHRILDAARFAPSGANQQPWHVVVVRDRAKREQIRQLSQQTWNEYTAQMAVGQRPFAPSADGRWHGTSVDLAAARIQPSRSEFLDSIVDVPVVLVVLVRLTALAMMDVELDREHFVAGGSIYPFCQNILLAARAEGLGGTLTTFLSRRENEARAVLNFPTEYAIASLITLGHPEKHVTKLKRRAVNEFTTIDTFDGSTFGG